MSHPFITAYADVILRRVDEVLDDKSVSRPAMREEKNLLMILKAHVGKGNAVSRTDLASTLDLSDRDVRWIVRELRGVFGIHVGSDRTDGGYFLVATATEDSELTQPLCNQALSLLRTYRRLTSREATTELLGQLRIDLQLNQEDTNAAA